MKPRSGREALVWAAVYAAHVEACMFSAPDDCHVPGNEKRWAEYEVNVAVQACERADAAVLRLREAERERRRS